MNMQLNFPDTLDMERLHILTDRFDDVIDGVLASKLESLGGKQVVFSNYEKEFSPSEPWDINHHLEVNSIVPVNEPRCVVGIDSSCIFLGETVEGSIYAAKGGIAVSYCGKHIMHYRIAPLVFYINEENVDQSNLEGRLRKFVLYDISAAKRMIRTRIERALQKEIATILNNSIILIDGSLKRSVFENKQTCLELIIKRCAENSNELIGISKTTRLKILDKFASSMMRNNGPCYVDVSRTVKSLVCNVVGRALLAKFDINRLVVRADVPNDPTVPLGLLLTNELMTNGYPETLRIAHHVSLFTQTDVTCLRSLILGRLGARELTGNETREMLLGSLV